MDSSELLPLAGALLFAVLCVYTWFQARALSSKALRLSLRIGAVVMATAAIFFAAALLIVGIGYTRHLPPVVSPDGKHLALIAYTVNSGTASDIAEVSVRSAWIPYSYRVYVGPGQFQPMAATPEPQVLWTDPTHLTIRFHRFEAAANSNGEQGCAAQADGITITCEETRVLTGK